MSIGIEVTVRAFDNVVVLLGMRLVCLGVLNVFGGETRVSPTPPSRDPWEPEKQLRTFTLSGVKFYLKDLNPRPVPAYNLIFNPNISSAPMWFYVPFSNWK